MVKVDFAVPAAGFKRKPSASLPQAAHLQNFRRRELIQIADQRVARVNPFRRFARFAQRPDEFPQRAPQLTLGPSGDDPMQLLLLSALLEVGSSAWRQAHDAE